MKFQLGRVGWLSVWYPWLLLRKCQTKDAVFGKTLEKKQGFLVCNPFPYSFRRRMVENISGGTLSIRPPFCCYLSKDEGRLATLLILKVRDGISCNRHNRAEHTNKWPTGAKLRVNLKLWRFFVCPYSLGKTDWFHLSIFTNQFMCAHFPRNIAANSLLMICIYQRS